MHDTNVFQNLASIMGLATSLNISAEHFVYAPPLKQGIVIIIESLFHAVCINHGCH